MLAIAFGCVRARDLKLFRMPGCVVFRESEALEGTSTGEFDSFRAWELHEAGEECTLGWVFVCLFVHLEDLPVRRSVVHDFGMASFEKVLRCAVCGVVLTKVEGIILNMLLPTALEGTGIRRSSMLGQLCRSIHGRGRQRFTPK